MAKIQIANFNGFKLEATTPDTINYNHGEGTAVVPSHTHFPWHAAIIDLINPDEETILTSGPQYDQLLKGRVSLLSRIKTMFGDLFFDDPWKQPIWQPDWKKSNPEHPLIVLNNMAYTLFDISLYMEMLSDHHLHHTKTARRVVLGAARDMVLEQCYSIDKSWVRTKLTLVLTFNYGKHLLVKKPITNGKTTMEFERHTLGNYYFRGDTEHRPTIPYFDTLLKDHKEEIESFYSMFPEVVTVFNKG